MKRGKKRKEDYSPKDVVLLNRLRKRLKSFRVIYGYSQQELGKLLGYNVKERITKLGYTFLECSCITQIERGIVRISTEKLYLISKLYNVSIDIFFQDAEPKIVVGEMYEPDINIFSEESVTKAIATRVRYKRILLGETQQQLADMLSVTTNHAYLTEHGKVSLGVNQLYLLAEHYHVPVSYFFQDLD